MRRQLRRFLLALGISAGGFAGTVIWFNASKQPAIRDDRKPLARLSSTSNEVQRKPVQRVIWESVSKNDELFTGEAIRTAQNAEAQLYFMKTGTTVHLDPDSLIVLEETNTGLRLDFMQGNLFVQSSDKGGADNLTLKTGGDEIHLKSADMSLSKAQNGTVDLEVHRGEAELSHGSQKTALSKEHAAELTDQGVSVSKDRLQVTHPLAGQTLLLNLGQGDQLDVAWATLPAGYNVQFNLGSSRETMQPINAGGTPTPDGHSRLHIKPGHWYLRVVARSADPQAAVISSNVIPFTVQPKSAPTLLEPRSQAHNVLTQTGQATTFRWLDRLQFVSQVMEVARDPQFKAIEVRETLDGETNSLTKALSEGDYYWRVTGYLHSEGKDESLVSSINKFSISSGYELKPPALLYPKNEQQLTFFEIQNSGLAFKWQNAPGVNLAEAHLEKAEGSKWTRVDKQVTENSEWRPHSALEPGDYRWHVFGLDAQAHRSPPSPDFIFHIQGTQKLEWADARAKETYRYYTPKPTLNTSWKTFAAKFSEYRYRLTAEGDDDSKSEWHSSKVNSFTVTLPHDGSYQVTVQAVTEQAQVIAQSETKTFTVEPQPLLPAPQWVPGTPDILKGDGRGNLTLDWQQVTGAERYVMTLESAQGEILQQREVKRNTASLQSLKPGSYRVKLKSIDGAQRPGESSPPRTLEVPSTSDIRAPKFKVMKVN